MPRGYRLLVIALGLVLAGAAPPKEKQVSAKAAEQVSPASTPSPSYIPYPDKHAEGCYGSKDHDTADLCAQWRAAIAAEKSANSTGWGNLIGAIGAALSFASIILVILALKQTDRSLTIAQRDRATATRRAIASDCETKAALEIARKNAEASERSVAETRRIGEAQVRCYPTTISAEIGHSAANIIMIKIIAKNTGLSPAKKVTFDASISYLISRKISIFSEENPDKIEFEIDIPAGESDELTSTVLLTPRYDVPKLPDYPFHVLITMSVDIKCIDVFDLDVIQTDKFSVFLPDIPVMPTGWIKMNRDSRVKLGGEQLPT